eukprot:366110-Chlamydomonas_euryale.AAC.10
MSDLVSHPRLLGAEFWEPICFASLWAHHPPMLTLSNPVTEACSEVLPGPFDRVQPDWSLLRGAAFPSKLYVALMRPWRYASVIDHVHVTFVLSWTDGWMSVYT